MALEPLTPQLLSLALAACPNCAGSGHDPEFLRDSGGAAAHPETTCAQCNGLTVALDVPPQSEGLLLYLAASRWIYSDEPDRLDMNYQDATPVETALVMALEEHGYRDFAADQAG